jgi:methylenetetrahydrofolate dehydrogenase (NADP+) / methenyltetrahydrofolate cyclohydrolase
MPNFLTRFSKLGFNFPQNNVSFHNNETSAYFENTCCLKLSGLPLQKKIIEEIKNKYALKKLKPSLTVFLIGENEASQTYVAAKEKAFLKAGLDTKTIKISAQEATQENIEALIEAENKNTNTHGILVQLPLPQHLNSEKIISKIYPQKDVDGFLAQNIGGVCLNQKNAVQACTPFGVMALLYYYGINFRGKHAVVIGRSNIVGKPMGMLLLNEDCTVTTVHSKSEHLETFTKNADILVVAAGKPNFISPNMVKPGATIIDVGIHRDSFGKLVGDVQPNVQTVAGALSPVPGGVGPLTIAMLLVNTCLAFEGVG